MKWLLIIFGILGLLIVAYVFYGNTVANPRVMEALRSDPQGARAGGPTPWMSVPSG